MKGIFLFIKKLGVDAYDLIPAERQNKTTALPVASVLASTEFEYSNSLVKGFTPLIPRMEGDDTNGHFGLCSSYNFSFCI